MVKHIQKLSLFFAAILLLGVVDTTAQEKGKVKDKLIHAMTQDRNSSGREFYLAFPFNDMKGANEQNLAIYVTSSEDTKVTLTNKALGINMTLPVKAYEITTFSTAKETFDWGAEIYDIEKATPAGFKITSPKPIAVYAMNSKLNTSEGYLAIPTNYWGTDYVHCSYYDFKEQADPRDWGAGFVIIAKEDQTNVTIRIRDGKNQAAGFGETYKGRVHGDVFTVNLNEGEVYAVQGTGKTRGIFDLSGSLITSDKPVGLLSYHNRTMIPSTVVTNGRDHLIEMIPPIQAWGTEYATVEYDRKKDKGDYFRVVAGEDNVTFNINWWDKDNGDHLGRLGPIKLQKKGDWFEYNETGVEAPHNIESIRGVSHFKADGPVLVMQYSYSANFDGADGNYDPFMIVTTAVEQYTKQTVFQTPANYTNDEFRNNFFNIVAIGDAEDDGRNQDLLSSITIDDQRIVDLSPAFLGNNIPGTDLFWAFISPLDQGTHRLKGDTPFGGYIYGFAGFDSYGWPAATAYGNLAEIDTLPPIVTFPPACFEWTINNVDDPEHERNGDVNDDPRQVDVGVRELPELLTGSFNFDDPVYVDEDGNVAEWSGADANYDFNYKIKVTDPFQNGLAILRVKDDVGNYTDTTIVYNVDQILSDPDPIVYGKVRVNTDRTLDVKISSGSEDPVEISEIKLRVGDVYTIDTDLSFVPFILEPMGDTTLNITYTPIDEYIDLNTDPELQFDFDTLVVTTGCLEWEFAMLGQGVQPEIIVDDYNAGLTQVGDFTLSSNNTFDDGVLIQNFGTDTLFVEGLENLTQPFSLPNMPGASINGDKVTFDEPIVVPNDDKSGTQINEVVFNQDLDSKYLIRFEPTSTNNADNTIDVLFVSDAAEEDRDDESRWYGLAQSSGPQVLGHTFPDTRVDAVSNQLGYVTIENIPSDIDDPTSGSVMEVILNTLRLRDDDGNFRIQPNGKIQGLNSKDNVVFDDLTVNRIALHPQGLDEDDKVTKILVPVEFTPLSIGNQTDAVVVEFDEAGPGENIFGEGVLLGKGFIPVIDVTNQKFAPSEADQGIHPTQGRIVVTNVSEPKDGEYSGLVINSIGFDNNSPSFNQFENLLVDGTPIANFNGTTLTKDQSLIVTYDFNTDGTTAGTEITRLIVMSDAGPADENGDEPNSENDYEIVFDGNYTEDNQSGIDDGGYIEGPIYSLGVNATPVPFGRNSLCDLFPLTTTVTNTGSGDDAIDETIIGVRYIGNDPNLDVYEFEVSDYQGVVVEKDGGTAIVRVSYKAGTREGVYNNALYQFEFESGKTAPFAVSGEIEEDVFRLTLSEHVKVTPGDDLNMTIDIKAVDSKYESAKINTMNVTLRYKPEWLSYTGEVGNGNLVNWTITDRTEEVLVGGEIFTNHIFTLVAPQGVTLDNDGVLFTPIFTYLLHSVPEGQSDGDIRIMPEISNVFFGQRDACITDETVPGLVTSQFCVQNYRSIDLIIGDNSGLKAISPNPVVGNMNLDFIVSTEAQVNIDVTNAEGKKVKQLLNGRLNAGQYETTADVSDLPAGVYLIHFTYLGVDQTQSIVITK